MSDGIDEWGGSTDINVGEMTPQQVNDYLYGKQFDPVQYQTGPIDYGQGFVVNPDNTVSYTAPNASSFANIIKSLFDPKTAGGFAGLAGLAALAGQSRLFNAPPTRVGYQGTIPQYTATRTQTPVEEQRPAGYRPGQGGVRYFNPVEYTPKAAAGGAMNGGIAELSRGRFLRGGGDGVSDSIPARFAGSGNEARLADGEFVIPARVVAELGNGSSEAGARKLYAMLDRVERAAKKAKRGGNSHADKYLPA